MIANILLQVNLLSKPHSPYVLGGFGIGNSLTSKVRVWEVNPNQPEGQWESWRDLNWKGMYGFNVGSGYMFPINNTIDTYLEVRWKMATVDRTVSSTVNEPGRNSGISLITGISF